MNVDNRDPILSQNSIAGCINVEDHQHQYQLQLLNLFSNRNDDCKNYVNHFNKFVGFEKKKMNLLLGCPPICGLKPATAAACAAAAAWALAANDCICL